MNIERLEQAIVELVQEFYDRPQDFFHEQELHTQFHAGSRERLGKAVTRDGRTVSLLRHEYETLWRYSRKKDQYRHRYDGGVGTKAATIDFALLAADFVGSHDYLTVVNKDDERRARLRSQLDLVAIQAGIEFKMAHVRSALYVDRSAIRSFQKEMEIDCRKLAHERVAVAYILGFSHGPAPLQEEARLIFKSCQEQYESASPRGPLKLMLTTPESCLLEPRASWCVQAPPSPHRSPAEIQSQREVPNRLYGRNIVCYRGDHCLLNLQRNGAFSLFILDGMGDIVRGHRDENRLSAILDELQFVEEAPRINRNDVEAWRRYFDELSLRHKCESN